VCGIAGILGASGAAKGQSVRRMLDALVHRGPDQEGLWTGPGLVLGHRRLSILDLSEAGRQPMLDPQTGCAIVFNGEVYNFAELRAELERAGRRFVSGSDTQMLPIARSRRGWSATQWACVASPGERGDSDTPRPSRPSPLTRSSITPGRGALMSCRPSRAEGAEEVVATSD
jgi:glutamine phosphoribosylpyrophosphate amidotransferase